VKIKTSAGFSKRTNEALGFVHHPLLLVTVTVRNQTTLTTTDVRDVQPPSPNETVYEMHKLATICLRKVRTVVVKIAM
jgi:hypothetical protein